MNNSEYWRKRVEELEKAQILNEAKYVVLLKEEYEKALSSIKKETGSWLARFSINNQISLKESKKWLNANELKELQWDVNEYIKYGQENGIDLIWKKELENASAKVHISRLEALQLQIQNEIEKLSFKEQKSTQEFILDTYADTYYKMAYEIQKGNNVAFHVAALDTDTLKKIISKPWTTDNLTFSDRIWKNKKSLIDTLQKDLTQSIIKGEGPDKVIEKISKDFNVSKNRASTLVMSESAFFGSSARKKCFKDLWVQKYENVATLDSHTSEICREIDGTVFDMSDYEEGTTAPPFHVKCRTTTAPHFEDEFEFGERAARNTDGKTYYIPSNIKYEEWEKRFVNTKEIVEDNKLPEINNVIEKMPNKVTTQLQDTKFVIDSDKSAYDRKNNIIHLLKNPTEREIIHEIGHAVETKYNVFKDDKFINILKDNISEMDILMAKTIDTYTEPIDIIENEKFISEYQGRIYNFDMFGNERYNSDTKEFNYRVLGEYFSEGFATYFTDRPLLLKKDKKLHDYIKELLNG